MSHPLVSIIIRTKNEERWIKLCLDSVFNQTFKDFEVIVVDNNSTDNTIKRVNCFPAKVIAIDNYRPGKALNTGIIASTGKFIVCLSGHCIPSNNTWLENIISSIEDKEIAGIYGRQLPMSFTSPRDKRDLLITFGLDRRIQVKDSFFHNANSAIKRSVWNEIPFDDSVTNIEDRIWANQVLQKGYKILYEPDSAVYHHHGIHHNGDNKRAVSTAQVLEDLQSNMDDDIGRIDKNKLKIVSLIPVQGHLLKYYEEPILKHTINYSIQCDLINDTIVLTDSKEAAAYAEKLGATVPFIRDPEHSKEYVDLSMVYAAYLNKIEDAGIFADLIVSFEPTFIFRPPHLVNRMVNLLLEKGYDSVVPVVKDYNPAWFGNGSIKKRVDSGDIPRNLKREYLLISAKGLGLITHPEIIHEGRLIGENCGYIEAERNYASLEVRSRRDIEILNSVVNWVNQNSIPDEYMAEELICERNYETTHE